MQRVVSLRKVTNLLHAIVSRQNKLFHASPVVSLVRTITGGLHTKNEAVKCRHYRDMTFSDTWRHFGIFGHDIEEFFKLP